MNQAETPWLHESETGVTFDRDINDPPKFTITPSEWTHVCACRFGESRVFTGKIKWTGDSCRYDIYTRMDGIGRKWAALRWANGSGCGWLLARDDCGKRNLLLDNIAQIENEAQRWDYCHFLYQTITGTARAAAVEAEREIKKAFVEGRLKKRKKQGEYVVTITG
jgi:hypothetical protein